MTNRVSVQIDGIEESPAKTLRRAANLIHDLEQMDYMTVKVTGNLNIYASYEVPDEPKDEKHEE